ncbi:MAG TPA: pyruvate dehydrogenase (acetyl-transferring), homodimeric type, partial [Lacipirellulaceae bacterium]|nr:pyruvate dehydrogenase (acetyl-transferring), homodimeric type [Lacipirellulaceae bacterium]
MANANAKAPAPAEVRSLIPGDSDPIETAEWLESLDYVLESKGPERVQQLLTALDEAAYRSGIELPFTATTPYLNTISREKQPRFPGNRELERRIKSFVRWNAMAMVTRANRDPAAPGGHISTFASSATLYEVALNHFIRGRGEDGYSGDQVYYQGHAAPGMYARA